MTQNQELPTIIQNIQNRLEGVGQYLNLAL